MDTYYVYLYKDGSEVVYVGMGQKDRAWNCRAMRGDTKERQGWKEEQMALGRLPCDWVSVYSRGLTKKEALSLETELIEFYQPRLNKDKNPAYRATKADKEGVNIMQVFREMGYSYSRIAHLCGGTTMTAHRLLNGGVKNA